MAKLTQKNEYESGGVAFVGCVLIGIGVGLLYDQVPVGALISAGVGLIVMVLLRR